jgi:hypothetical protein
MINNLKLVVSGFPGTGKTTLVNAISSEFSLPIIQENMFQIGDLNRQLNIAIKEKRQKEIPGLIKKYCESFLDWDAKRAAEYRKHEGFIADRWEADLLDYWLLSSSSYLGDLSKVTTKLLKNLQEKSKNIDICILTPLIEPFSHDKNEEGNVRTKGFTTHLRNIVTTVGIIKTFTKTTLIMLPNSKMTLDERLDFVKKSLTKINIKHS